MGIYFDDFLLDVNYRGLGVYQNILKLIFNSNVGKNYIFDLNENIASIKAIEKVGFLKTDYGFTIT